MTIIEAPTHGMAHTAMLRQEETIFKKITKYKSKTWDF